MGKCKFNEKWLEEDKYRCWLKPSSDLYEARCEICRRTLKLGTMGFKALDIHMKSEKHKRYAATHKGTRPTELFDCTESVPFTANISTQEEPSEHTTSQTAGSPSTATLKADGLWVLQTVPIDESSQSVIMDHTQACINLEKATQFITEALKHEVCRNQELCGLIRSLEESEAETARSLMEQVESTERLKLRIGELQKKLEEKDNSLTQARQHVALLKNELTALHQQFQTQESKLRTLQEVNESLQSGKSQLKVEMRAMEGPAPEIKEEEEVGGYDGYGEYHQSEKTDLEMERTTFSVKDIKTELIQEEEVMSNMAPVLSSEINLSPTNAMTLVQSREVLLVLVGCGRTQGQQGTNEDNRLNGQPVDWKGSSSIMSTPPSESPAVSMLQQDSTSPVSIPETEENSVGLPCSVCGHRLCLPMFSVCNVCETRRYPCSECGRRFRFRCHLKLHERIHTGEKPYSCPQCGKHFRQKVVLQVHQRIHTGEKPYTCSRCNKKFRAEAHFKRHMLCHTGEKPYSCPDCRRCFSLSENLKKHMRIHTGETPYVCSQCDRRFMDVRTLRRHERNQACLKSST